MERHNKEKQKRERHATRRVTPLFWSILLLFMSTNPLLANPITDQPGATQGGLSIAGSLTGINDNISAAINPMQSNKGSEKWVQKLYTVFPRLERALIITTIINFIVIIFVVLFYIVKRRMIQFTSSTIGNIKLNSQAKNEFLDNLHNETS